MGSSDPWALVSEALSKDIISNIRRTLAILRALKGTFLLLAALNGLRKGRAQVMSKRFANTISDCRH